jgi:hypothetical protein
MNRFGPVIHVSGSLLAVLGLFLLFHRQSGLAAMVLIAGAMCFSVTILRRRF